MQSQQTGERILPVRFGLGCFTYDPAGPIGSFRSQAFEILPTRFLPWFLGFRVLFHSE
jgi:hypothetical protein